MTHLQQSEDYCKNVPKYLANVTAEVRKSILQIFKNTTSANASKEAEIMALITLLEPTVQAAYTAWKTQLAADLAKKVSITFQIL